MGVINFLVPRRDRLPADAIERIYVAGIDEIPWRSRTHWTDTGLAIERNESDSGNIFVPYDVAGQGELMLSTASLMERAQPYHLEVELARGTLNRLRNQMAGWQSMGMAMPPALTAPLEHAYGHLSRAVTRRDDPQAAAEGAEQCIRASLEAIQVLVSGFADQALAARHHQVGKLNTLLGITLGSTVPGDAISQQLAAAFNTAVVPLQWRDIEGREGKRDWTQSDQQLEWCRARGMRICSGPLLLVDKFALPDWMYLWGEGEEENFRSCVAEHIQAVVTRYRGKVQLWQCSARLNRRNDFAHDEEERLRLAVLSIESIRRADPRAPVVITIEQPWGAFMSREDCDLSPLHFADALVRADLGLNGIGLEINVAHGALGTEPRDALEFGRQLDRWGTLGLPLLVSVTVPSSSAADPQARADTRSKNHTPAREHTPESQVAWGRAVLPALLARQPVQGIIWNQLLDSQLHTFPHGGLFDAQDKPKPMLEFLTELRKTHLA